MPMGTVNLRSRGDAFMDLFGGLLVVGLLLWWIIQYDLDRRDREKRILEQNEKREANERAAKLAWEAQIRGAIAEFW
jgi:hypothetical protein